MKKFKQSQFSFTELKAHGKSSETIQFVDTIASVLKFSMFQKINNPDLKVKFNSKNPLSRVERLLHRIIDSASQEQKKNLLSKFNNDDFLRKEFSGILKKEEYRETKTDSFKQLNLSKYVLPYNIIEILKEIFKTLGLPEASITPDVIVAPPPVETPKPNFTEGLMLRLNLQTIKCKTEQSWEPEKDEISIGGAATDDKQINRIVNEFNAGSFSSNETRNFNPQELISFPLDNIHPSSFIALLSLSEHDFGSMFPFINDLFNILGKFAGEIVKKYLLPSAVAAIGAVIALPAGFIGVILGVLAGLIIGAIFNWIAGLFGDEITEPQIIGITLNEVSHLNTPITTLNFKNTKNAEEFDADYDVSLFWSVS